MIKRITLPALITLEQFCDENDLTIIVTDRVESEGDHWFYAEIQGSEYNRAGESEKIVLAKLARSINRDGLYIDGRVINVPMLRCY